MTTLPALASTTTPGSAFDLEAVIDRAAGLARQARAPNTLRAYESDWREFEGWCAAIGVAPLPAPPGLIGAYIAAHEHLSVATLSR